MCFDLAEKCAIVFHTSNSVEIMTSTLLRQLIFTMKTLSATPRPYNHWKAESLSFLHVLLVWEIELTSLLIKMRQS